jgi:hypothetical protein
MVWEDFDGSPGIAAATLFPAQFFSSRLGRRRHHRAVMLPAHTRRKCEAAPGRRIAPTALGKE